MMIQETLQQLMRGENLSQECCRDMIDAILNPETPEVQIAAFLVLLRHKRETAEELFAIIKSLQDKMMLVKTPHTVLDIVGTGGDGMHTVNISTGSAMLAAACGVKIAKHGNRAVSSLAGSADVLEALGVNIQLSPEKIANCIDTVGIGFCYSPNFHQATKTIRELRKTLGVPTTFNYIGPFLNPARASHLVLGVADPTLLSTMADVLVLMKNKKSVLVHGAGMDEISCVGPTKIIEIDQGQKTEYMLDPKKLGLSYCTVEDLRGGDAKTNANLLKNTLKGKKGPIADTLLLNAAVALYIYGISPTIDDALTIAKENLSNGNALKLLNHWIEFSHD